MMTHTCDDLQRTPARAVETLLALAFLGVLTFGAFTLREIGPVGGSDGTGYFLAAVLAALLAAIAGAFSSVRARRRQAGS